MDSSRIMLIGDTEIRHKDYFVRDNIHFSYTSRSIYKTKHQLIIVRLTHQEHLFDFKASVLTESSRQSLITQPPLLQFNILKYQNPEL
jgi:hypothetical protein